MPLPSRAATRASAAPRAARALAISACVLASTLLRRASAPCTPDRAAATLTCLRSKTGSVTERLAIKARSQVSRKWRQQTPPDGSSRPSPTAGQRSAVRENVVWEKREYDGEVLGGRRVT